MSEYNRLVRELKELRRRVARREQADQRRLTRSQSNESAIKRDLRTARQREKDEVRNFQAKTGTRSKPPRKTKYPTAAETQAQAAKKQPRKVKYPTAAETRAAAAARRSANTSSSSGGTKRTVSGNYSRSGGTKPASKMPDELVTREKPGGARLRSDFDLDIGGRLGAALGGAQDEILAERKIKRGMNYGSEDTNPAAKDNYATKKPDYSRKAAEAKRSGKQPNVDTDDYLGLKAPNYSSKMNDTQSKKASSRSKGSGFENLGAGGKGLADAFARAKKKRKR